MKNNVVSLAEYKKRLARKEKSLTWLYSLSEFELISEFIDSHAEFEKNSDTKQADWLDTVSEVVSIKCFNTMELK